MAKGISIHVGINEVTSDVFSAPRLNHCEDDANAMFALATKAGFTPAVSPATGKSEPLLGEKATFANVVKSIQDAAQELKPGDTFLFTFSGHGSQEANNNFIEPDGRDETIVLSDHLLLDNVWRSDLWPRFDEGVRAIVVADCCHSGGAFTTLDRLLQLLAPLKNLMIQVADMLGLRELDRAAQSPRVVRRLDDDEKQKELERFKAFYDEQAALTPPPEGIRVSRVILSACKAGEAAVELDRHGAFTQALLDIWSDEAFPGPDNVFADNYIGFMEGIKSKFNDPNQHPQLRQEGQPDFTGQRPFSV